MARCSRRHFLGATGAAIALSSARPAVAAEPARTWRLPDFGAVPGGNQLCTAAFRDAIEQCHRAGGGRVVVPAGRWLTGPIVLKSNVELRVDKGATVAFSTDPADYLPVVRTRWQGIELYNYSPLIYADGQRNIAITGDGVLDAQGDNEHWWYWIGSGQYGWHDGLPNQRADWAALEDLNARQVPVDQRVFGAGHYLRPSFVQPYRCQNVLISGVTIRNPPMWTIHPISCRNVTIERVTVDSLGPNGDGCDPESCSDVTIRQCTFTTHDDCIAIKSGRDADGQRLAEPSRNILIEDCTFTSGGGAVALGSEMSGGVENVVARRLRMPFDATLDEPSVQWILSVKSTSTRGGYIRGVRVDDVDCPAWTYVPFEITFQYMGVGTGVDYPDVRRLSVDNWRVGRSEIPWRFRGAPEAPIRQIALSHCRFDNAADPPVVENTTGLRLRAVTVNGTNQPA